MIEVEDNCLSGFGVLLGYCPIPQMSIFVYGMLRRNHILIKIDIAVFINKTVDLTFGGGEGLYAVFLCVYRYVSWSIGTIIIPDPYEICSEIF